VLEKKLVISVKIASNWKTKIKRGKTKLIQPLRLAFVFSSFYVL